MGSGYISGAVNLMAMVLSGLSNEVKDRERESKCLRGKQDWTGK